MNTLSHILDLPTFILIILAFALGSGLMVYEATRIFDRARRKKQER